MDENAGNRWTYKLPISIPVPIYATIDPGAGGVSRVVRYGVRDGFWDGDERRFGGFLVGGKTVPADTRADTYYEETRFYAGLGEDRVLRGKPYLVEQQDGAKNVFTRKKFAVEARPVAGLPAGPLTKKPATVVEDGYNFEGVSKPIQTFTTYEYDNQVRPTMEHHSGRLDMTGDEKEVRRSYADSDFYWVRDKVYEESVLEGNGTLVSCTRTYYTQDGSSPLDFRLVGKGWVARVDSWLASPTDPSLGLSWTEAGRDVTTAWNTYDSYGNVLNSYKDGVVRTLGYDGLSFHPSSETVWLSGAAGDASAGTLAWSMTWDNVLGLPKTMTDPNQVVTTVSYDDLGRYTGASIGSYSPHVRYVYDWTAPMPRTTTYVYDGKLGSPGQAADPSQDWVHAAGWRQTTLVANGAGEDLFSATRLAEARWIVSDWKQRDSRGKIVLHGDPFYWDGADPRNAVPPTGEPSDPNYFRSQILKYDALGRLSEQDLPNQSVKTVTYKAFEQTVVASDLDPVRSVMDGQGRILHTERRVSGLLEYVDAAYNAAGQITSMSLQGGKVGQPEPGQALHRFAYDTMGRLVWAHDPDIGKREMRYADQGMLIRHKNGADNVLAFFYDHAARLTGRGARGVDSFGDPAASAFSPPVTGDYIYHYDERAQEVAQCGAAGTAGRLASVDEPAGNAPGTGRVAFCYDQLGRQSVLYRSLGGASANVGWQYDELGTSGISLQTITNDGFKLVPGYDRAGRLMSLSQSSTIPGQPTSVWLAGTNSADSYLGLDAAGRVLHETFGNQLVGDYTRDEIGLTASMSLKKGTSAPIFGLGIERNKYGAPTVVTDAVPTGLDQSAFYAYDGAARLRSAILGSENHPQWNFRYEYDGLQNMIGRYQQGPTAGATIGILPGEYYYGEMVDRKQQGPRQLSRIVDKDCGGATTTFSYDGAGRMTAENSAKGAKGLSYDGYDQLLKVTQSGKPDMLAAYGYDGLRTYSNGSDGTQYWFTSAYTQIADGKRWHYVGVGDRLVARITFPAPTNPVDLGTVLGATAWLLDFGDGLDRNASRVVVCGVTSAMLLLLLLGLRRRPPRRCVSAIVGSYALLLTTFGCDPEVSRKMVEVDGSRLYFHQGVAAGPTLITGIDGGIREERRFEPFGQPVEGTLRNQVDPTNSLNKQTNPDTGWSYHGARWMSPHVARWVAPDPAAKGPDPDLVQAFVKLNYYAYATQNPTAFWDPDGRDIIIVVGPNIKGNEGELFHNAAIRLSDDLKDSGVAKDRIRIVEDYSKVNETVAEIEKAGRKVSGSVFIGHGGEERMTATRATGRDRAPVNNVSPGAFVRRTGLARGGTLAVVACSVIFGENGGVSPETKAIAKGGIQVAGFDVDVKWRGRQRGIVQNPTTGLSTTITKVRPSVLYQPSDSGTEPKQVMSPPQSLGQMLRQSEMELNPSK